ncbi:hypothetical protein OKW31_004282 [Paraburkholderia atlantica]|uniref:hypothetical protein n=1 Tax=Paraburkholderia atlantica TaxID=2654982 RepID=UPI003D1C1280
MPTLFLDVSRLLSRLYNALLPTGVDRVGLAYNLKVRERMGANVIDIFASLRQQIQ